MNEWGDEKVINGEKSGMGLQRFSSTLSQSFENEDLGSFPSWWAATVATYCPNRHGELPKFLSSKPCDRVDEKRCIRAPRNFVNVIDLISSLGLDRTHV